MFVFFWRVHLPLIKRNRWLKNERGVAWGGSFSENSFCLRESSTVTWCRLTLHTQVVKDPRGSREPLGLDSIHEVPLPGDFRSPVLPSVSGDPESNSLGHHGFCFGVVKRRPYSVCSDNTFWDLTLPYSSFHFWPSLVSLVLIFSLSFILSLPFYSTYLTFRLKVPTKYFPEGSPGTEETRTIFYIGRRGGRRDVGTTPLPSYCPQIQGLEESSFRDSSRVGTCGKVALRLNVLSLHSQVN